MTTGELMDRFLFTVRRSPVSVGGPVCCRCSRSVERVVGLDQADGGIQVLFRCHGAVERLTIERVDLQSCFDVNDVFELFPKRVFWPGFSRYATTTKPLRRVL